MAQSTYQSTWAQTPAGIVSRQRAEARRRQKIAEQGHVPPPSGEKRCSKCGHPKPVDQFWKNKFQLDGLSPQCISCQSDGAKKSKRKSRYGVTQEQFQEMLLRDPVCPICLQAFPATPRVDHCHATDRVRGLLCHHCNVILGHAGDNIAVLERAVAYLKERV